MRACPSVFPRSARYACRQACAGLRVENEEAVAGGGDALPIQPQADGDVALGRECGVGRQAAGKVVGRLENLAYQRAVAGVGQGQLERREILSVGGAVAYRGAEDEQVAAGAVGLQVGGFDADLLAMARQGQCAAETFAEGGEQRAQAGLPGGAV